jgi:hypothetical protein
VTKNHPKNLELNIIYILEKSSSIWERLTGNYLPKLNAECEEIGKKRIENWCEKFAKGNWDNFKNRCDWDGIELDNIQQLLGVVYLKTRK